MTNEYVHLKPSFVFLMLDLNSNLLYDVLIDVFLSFQQILEFQIQAIMEEKVRMTKKKQKGMKSQSPSDLSFSCRGCNKHVCTGEDIEIIEKMHRVNVRSEFRYNLQLKINFFINVVMFKQCAKSVTILQ